MGLRCLGKVSSKSQLVDDTQLIFSDVHPVPVFPRRVFRSVYQVYFLEITYLGSISTPGPTPLSCSYHSVGPWLVVTLHCRCGSDFPVVLLYHNDLGSTSTSGLPTDGHP